MQLVAIDRQIAALENKLADLKTLRASIVEAETVKSSEADAYRNALESSFDGVKNVADRKNPFKLVLPMFVQPNMFYSRKEDTDEKKNVKKLYVCIKKGIVTEENFSEFLEADDE